MKKLLVSGGVLFSILPAMAADLDLTNYHLIDSNTANPTCVGPEGYTGFTDGDVTMTPLYVQNCGEGYYLNASSSTQIQEHKDGNNETDYYVIEACTQCQAGHSCAGVSNPTIVNNSLGVQGLGAECSAGTYATAGQSSCTACAPGTYTDQTGQSSCTNAQAGYYTPNTTSEELCPTGYQDGVAGSGTTINACSKTISCPQTCSDNFKHIKTSGVGACTIDDTLDGTSVAFGSANRLNGSCFEQFTCADGFEEQNLYTWLAANLKAIPATHTYCSPNGTGAGCSDAQNPMERGTMTWTLTGANRPMDKLNFVTACTSRTADFNNISTWVVDQTTADFNATDTGVRCWIRNVDLPNQPWMFVGVYYDAATCASSCGDMAMAIQQGSDYMFGTIENNNFAPVYNGLIVSAFTQMATVTSGQNPGDPSANICIASTVHINWAGVAEPGAAATCTYGEGLTLPTPDPELSGHSFAGWTVGEVTNNNNQNNNEPSNEEPGNNEPE